ncbi:MAG: TrkH family potassium uptake protein, partial [Firmicutes bacterium]|nr:TrkH family potassium uptake protein [Bacillota bacterium]
IAVSIYPVYSSAAQALRQAFFQVCSIISTTGYCSVDWSLWPQFAQMVLVMLMFCGACAGSTGGGIKCSRVLILLRTLRREIHRIAHPRAVEVIKLDGKVVNEDTVRSIMIFLGSYMLIILMGTLLISLDNFSFTVSFTSALTCVSNVGPGLEMVGPVGNFSAFSAFSKLVMSLCMIIGRLEILPVLMLCSRVTWRRN